MIKTQLQTNSMIVSLWGQYRESNTAVHTTIDKVQPLLEAPMVFNTQADVKAALDRTKVRAPIHYILRVTKDEIRT